MPPLFPDNAPEAILTHVEGAKTLYLLANCERLWLIALFPDTPHNALEAIITYVEGSALWPIHDRFHHLKGFRQGAHMWRDLPTERHS